VTSPSRISRAVILSQLKLAARKGDRAALTLATEHMKMWAYSPRYWKRYLDLLAHPLARLVDLLLIKQGEKIARQKGWVRPRRRPSKPAPKRQALASRRAGPRATRGAAPTQPWLFPEG
jgi:hypothetical protein